MRSPNISCGLRTSMVKTLLLKPSIFSPNKHTNFLHFQSTNHLLRPYAIPLNSSSHISTLSINPKFPPKYEIKTPKSSITKMGIMPNAINPIGLIIDEIANALNAFKWLAIATLFVSALLLYDPKSAFAASGGRMGGSSFSRRSSTSSSKSYSGSHRSSSSFHSHFHFGVAPGWIVFQKVLWITILVLFVFIAFVANMSRHEYSIDDTKGTSVIKLQIGLKGTAPVHSLQSELNRIAYSADTSTPKGQYHVLTETLKALVQHADHCNSAYSFVVPLSQQAETVEPSLNSLTFVKGGYDYIFNYELERLSALVFNWFSDEYLCKVSSKRSIKEGEKTFNQLSVEERGKFDEESLVNVNNSKIQSTKSMRATGHINEYIVVTILVAVEGSFSLSTISSNKDLKEAMQKLRSISSSNTMAVEVLWTPQKENDTLSEKEYLDDYPLLKPL